MHSVLAARQMLGAGPSTWADAVLQRDTEDKRVIPPTCDSNGHPLRELLGSVRWVSACAGSVELVFGTWRTPPFGTGLASLLPLHQIVPWAGSPCTRAGGSLPEGTGAGQKEAGQELPRPSCPQELSPHDKMA